MRKSCLFLLVVIFFLPGCATRQSTSNVRGDDALTAPIGSFADAWHRCERKKEAFACYVVGRTYREGREVRQNKSLAMKYFRRACKLHSSLCSFIPAQALHADAEHRVMRPRRLKKQRTRSVVARWTTQPGDAKVEVILKIVEPH